ncbi:MAG: phosphohydrolase [Pseudomonadota bacterium]
MNLIPLKPESIKLGQPLPFSLRTQDGTLLAHKGFIVGTRAQLDTMLARAGVLHIDLEESPDQARAFMNQLDTMVREQRTIGQIASTQMSAGKSATDKAEDAIREGPPDWQELQLRATAMLKNPRAPDFLARLERLHTELRVFARRQPDATLFALIHFAARELSMYSATHGMLVAVVCGMAAQDTLRWDATTVNAVVKAALTMNISMTELQDQLAQQTARPNESQMAAIAVHSNASAELLEKQGITDPLWLNAVRRHHEPPSGPLADMAPADRIARLVERADIFAARLAPRVSRWAMPAAIAMRASYFDDEHRVDEAGAALITAMGVYPPGSFVKLASNETAIVLKRGRTGTTPKVAAVLNRQGTPIGEIVVRDTSQVAYKIVASVAHRDVKVQLQLDRMLGMI